jgi:hypothetical protein
MILQLLIIGHEDRMKSFARINRDFSGFADDFGHAIDEGISKILRAQQAMRVLEQVTRGSGEAPGKVGKQTNRGLALRVALFAYFCA